MNIFFDTSSLIKLYHEEEDTAKLLNLLDNNPGYKIFLSELTLVEAYSAIFKKLRIRHLSLEQANLFLPVLDKDFREFSFIPLNKSILINTQKLIVVYGSKGLRSLDAIQLASAINIKSTLDLILTGDNTLKKIFIEEGFNCDF